LPLFKREIASLCERGSIYYEVLERVKHMDTVLVVLFFDDPAIDA